MRMPKSAALALAILTGFTSPADAESFRSEYVVTLFGLPVARSNFDTTIDDSRFSINGTVRSAGFAEFFDDTRGTIKSSGAVGKAGASPAAYAVDYTTGKKKKLTRIGFAGGSVTSVSNTPPVKKSGNWIEVDPSHLKSVADPLTVFMIKSESLQSVCTKRLRLFDGEMRNDFVLSPVGETVVETAGYSGPAMTCAVRFVPVSGYRQGKKQIEYLKKNRNMQVTFAPMRQTGFYAPVIAKIGTQIGTVTVRAARFE
jgi:Protein of unknown function (DUF3108)